MNSTVLSIEDQIINKVNRGPSYGWGNMVNDIQDAAEAALTPKEYKIYSKISYEEYIKTEGQDGVLFNGEYFDWRQFDTQRIEIVKAYLKYFTESQLHKILVQL